MNKYCLAILLTFSTIDAVFGQEFSSRMWHVGWMVTTEQDTLRGPIKYDMVNNAVQIVVENKMYTFSSKKIIYFEIFDNNLKNYRHFYAIPYNIRPDYKAPILFEILYEGPTTLLLRERIVIETRSDYYSGIQTSYERLVFSYYFVDQTAKIVLFEGQKGEIYGILKKNPEKLKEYIKENKLKTDEMGDLVRITAFYNSL